MNKVSKFDILQLSAMFPNNKTNHIHSINIVGAKSMTPTLFDFYEQNAT
jgi:hypothetical protein